jgi:flagellin
MALGVLNNLSAIYAENNLNNTNSSLQTVLEQLSSGSKINSGADDAAGLSLVNGLKANQSALTQSGTNATEGVGLLQVADGALSQVTSLLDRAITLATEASNGTLNSSQDAAANQEYQSILSEVNNIGQTTTYNQEQVFDGKTIAIYTGDSSTAGSSIDDLNIRSLSEASVGDTGGAMAYSDGSNNVFLNLSSSTANAQATDTLNAGGTTTIKVNYLVKGNGTESTATTSIPVGTGTSYGNTANDLINAINNSGLGLTASFATQAQAGVTGGGTQTGIEITGGLVSAGVDPSASSTSGTLNPSGISASELLTQGQTVTVKVGGTTAAAVTINSSINTLQELADQINANLGGAAGLATASVVTNGDGTQSLSLASTATNGVLTVTTTTGSAPTAPVLSNLTTATNASTTTLDTPANSVTGTAANPGVAGSLTLGVAINSNSVVDSNADTVAGNIILTDGSLPAQTFVMGSAGATTTASNLITTINVHGNTMTALATAIQAQLVANGDIGATAVAGTSGLVITSGTLGYSVAATTNNLVNTNATLGLYMPTDSGPGVYGTGLLALTNAGGTAITGTIAAADTLVGSVVIQDGAGAPETFTMGGAGATNTVGTQTTVHGNSMANLLSAINAVTTLVGGAAFKIAATTDTGASGGIYLQSGTLGNNITMTETLSDAYAENISTSVAGQAVVVGSASSITIGSAGSVNTNEVLAGTIAITNSVSGAPVTETFKMGTSANDGTASKGTLSGTTFTVNGNTLADLQDAINSQTAAVAGISMDLGLTALASTAGLGLTSKTNSGVAVTAISTLSDITPGTASAVTLGSFANGNDTVSGILNFDVGTTPVSLTLAADSTVSTMIQQINLPANNTGVTASWVAGTNGNGSVLLTSNTAGSAGQITATSGQVVLPTSTITDTTATATLSYAPTSAYNTGLSGTIADSTTGQTAEAFSSDAQASSGIATMSYTDASGESLSGTDLNSQSDAQIAVTKLNAAITDAAAQDGYIGAQINTLEAVSQVMSTQQENVTSAQNAIQATDYASATSNMSKYEILSQTGIAALAQANSVQQEVTKLLQ